MPSPSLVAVAMACAAVLLGTAACGSPRPASGGATDTVRGRTLTVSGTTEDLRATLAPGDTLHLQFAVQPGTGYAWRLAERAPEEVTVTDLGFSAPEASGEAERRGGDRVQTLRVIARAEGRYRLRLELARPWEPGAIRSRALLLDVTKGAP
ncbi:MAG: protease inhibitor I42 family protein [Bacteroidota bacterium]